jgi:amino acid transporter
MFGNVSGMTLATPRALYALGRDGFVPFFSESFARVHPEFRTPYVAIVVQSTIIGCLATTNGFVALAVLANVSVLTLYLVCCAATIQLRRLDVQQAGVPFRMPRGRAVPYVAIVVLAWILWHSPVHQMLVVLAVILVAACLFVITAPYRRAAPPVPTP